MARDNVKIRVVRQRLTSGSSVYNVEIVGYRDNITFAAVDRENANAFAKGILKLIKAHTVEIGEIS